MGSQTLPSRDSLGRVIPGYPPVKFRCERRRTWGFSMATKRNLAKQTGKLRQSKSATLLETLWRKKDTALYDEHREIVQLQHAAYRPHTEHAQSISARRYICTTDVRFAARDSGAWPLSHVYGHVEVTRSVPFDAVPHDPMPHLFSPRTRYQ